MKKKVVIIFGIIVVIIVISFVSVNIYFNSRNARYTQKLKDYSYFVQTTRNEHYIEYDDKFKIQIYSLFDIWKLKKLISVEISIGDVYWEEQDEYINIYLDIHEKISGELIYYISYRSNPMIIRTQNSDGRYREEVRSVNINGACSIDDEIPIEYEDFVRENSDEINKLFQRVSFYWNIPLKKF